MYKVKINVYSKPKFNGTFIFDDIVQACVKVMSNLDCTCLPSNAKEGIAIYGKASFFDVFHEGQASIQLIK